MRTSADRMLQLAEELMPIYRTITSSGLSASLEIIRDQELPSLKILGFKTGKKVFDWVIPPVYQVNAAYILTPEGKRICDFSENNLHLVAHSGAVDMEVSLEVLQEHIHSIPNQPQAIPYVTSYYGDTWGFCMTHEERLSLAPGKYRVFIDSSFRQGKMHYGELFLPGKTREEVLISTYLCHPNMANNELSGPVVATYLAKSLSESNNHYSYRFIFIPETIGSIAYLSKNLRKLKKRVRAGYVLTCIGDNREFSMVPSRNGKTLSDRAAQYVIGRITKTPNIYSWSDRGSDERQFCAPGVDLPIASLMRSKYHEYPEYHTSLDKIGTVVTGEGLHGGLEFAQQVISVIEKNVKPQATNKCEPMLSRHKLYPTISIKNGYKETKIFMELLTWADGKFDLIEISRITGYSVEDLYAAAEILVGKNLIEISF
jgi:aminopeptidase-like protein